MSDNILSAVLTFSLLAAGTAAIGTELFNTRHAKVAVVKTVVMLPAVTVIGDRTAPNEVVTLPAVTVIGHRAVEVAYEPRATAR